ncbi:LPP20 family lipoprotein [Aliarcobacter cryaerophilus]|uniref:LPP20 family lipoprotein n=1 Tax=Aliarcobacter cryaerophilus TaxID=28198 RepID=UPI0021B162CB|nr:LPP20 family lipoprotein [Aliarcobacter cryaerophilus]MCT7443783.1 LPP20 family lipoprotein [Aliarcobacter cryaerophilus]MCT7478729.1 LPP20 family lipoprotein [Aliarcobacter cryaerophilus]
MKYLLPIFFSIFFVACFGINKDEISQNNSLKYPSWYLNPPLNDGNILYGVGVANTKQEAILNALDDLSSRLMLTIQSNQEISLKSFRDYREYVSKTTTFNINTKSEKLTFKDYKIEDFYSFQKEIFYLISIKKSDLINSLNSQISNLYDEYEILKRSNDDILNKNIKYKELLEKFYINLNKAELLESLQNKNMSENRYIKTIQKIEEEIKNSISKISFFIKSDDNSEVFKEVFKNSLNKKSYKVVEKKDIENVYEIDLSSNQSKIRPSGFFIIENILNIKVKDKNNRQLSSKTIELKGASSNNFDDAKINLIQKLKKYEEQNSILPFE